jgi:hypothetical protein
MLKLYVLLTVYMHIGAFTSQEFLQKKLSYLTLSFILGCGKFAKEQKKVEQLCGSSERRRHVDALSGVRCHCVTPEQT